MPLLMEVDKLEAVPESQRGWYKEENGKFKLDPEKVSIEDVSGLKTALDSERERARAEEKTRKAVEKERDDLKRAKDAAAQGITEEQLQKIRDDEAKARKPIEDERDKFAAENRKLKLTDRVKAKALAAGIMPDRIDKAMRDLEGRVDLTEDGNSIVVKDIAGKPTAETIDDFLSKTYKAEAAFFYTGTGAPGSGADGSSGNAGAGGGAYDPVAAGKAAAKEQKKTAAENSLAFK